MGLLPCEKKASGAVGWLDEIRSIEGTANPLSSPDAKNVVTVRGSVTIRIVTLPA